MLDINKLRSTLWTIIAIGLFIAGTIYVIVDHTNRQRAKDNMIEKQKAEIIEVKETARTDKVTAVTEVKEDFQQKEVHKAFAKIHEEVRKNAETVVGDDIRLTDHWVQLYDDSVTAAVPDAIGQLDDSHRASADAQKQS